MLFFECFLIKDASKQGSVSVSLFVNTTLAHLDFMKITLSLTLLIGLLTPHLHAEPALFPAKNALALTVTEDGLVLEGADLVTSDLDNWEVSWPAVLEDEMSLPEEEIVVTKSDLLTQTSRWIRYGNYSFEFRESVDCKNKLCLEYIKTNVFFIYNNEQEVDSVLLDSHHNIRVKRVYATLKTHLTSLGFVTEATNIMAEPIFVRTVTIYDTFSKPIVFNVNLSNPTTVPSLSTVFSNSKRLYSFYPLYPLFIDGKPIIGYGSDAGIYSCSSSNLIFTPIDNQRALLPDPSTMTSRPDAIVDDSADAIIFEKRVYTNDNGQTWTYYDSPLPADYLSYDEGFFEYVTLPTEENGLTHPVRKRSADKGATWEEVENHAQIGDYSFGLSWNEETQTSEGIIIHPIVRSVPIYLKDWWVLDVRAFQDTFVVLLKHATDPDMEHQLLCLPVDNSPLTSTAYSEQVLRDGHWKVEVVREPKVRLTEEDINSAELLDLNYDNRISINLGYPTGRVENVIYGEADIESYPWVYSYELGWHAYFTSNDATIPGAFLWTPEESWLFTCVGYYPFIWSFVEENWIWVDVGEGRTKQWYLYLGDGNWKQIR